ncbi:MAG TPA: YciI family protein, partial [Candidatus Binataceae bacterium]|nr:YciI family protein [Candidatus Binataceae bacterium]
GLGPEDQTITLLRENDRFVETDGPYAEVKEVLGGFDIIDFDSRDGAIHFAKIKGAAKAVHVEEIRPIREMWWVHAGFGTGEAKVFMISMLDDGRPLPSSELQSAISAHEDTGNGYINQRTARDGKTMAFAGVRLGLASETATLRIADGKQLLSDGPFAETKEVLGGFQMITCETTAEAIEHAKRLCRRDGDLVEIRPVDATWWIYHA